ncbi:MAG: ferredoxin:protochlorophyllide reductase (ATP-dependent) subunit B, partial [Burkholderiaceae bacterium]
GFEGANVLFDTWIHPLMMGLEEHLIHMFREDFEFHDGAAPSHLGARAAPGAVGDGPVHAASGSRAESSDDEIAVAEQVSVTAQAAAMATAATAEAAVGLAASWDADAQRELHKIPFFVRGKARRNTERFALDRGISTITVETLYDAKAHFSR